MSLTPLGRLRASVIALGLLALFMSEPARAQAPAAALQKLNSSLTLVPAEASFYTASLRNREQVEAVLKSQAWAKLIAMPAVQDLLKKAQEELQKPDSPFAQAMAFYKQPENQQLVELLIDLGSQEVFCYGGDSFTGFVDLAMQIQGAMRFGPLFTRLQNPGAPDAQAQLAVILHVLKENLDLIKAPDLVIGFKATKPELAAAQLKRLETLLTGLLEQTPLKGRLKHAMVAGSEFLTFELDGSLVPWDKVPLKDLEGQPGEFDKLQKKLQGLKLTVSLGLHKGYVLLGIGESTAHLAKFGAGRTLVEAAEFKPLAKFTDRRLTNISYSSKKLSAAASTRPEDIDGMVEMVQKVLPQAGVPEALQKRLKKDVEALAKDLKGVLPQPGPSMSFSFLNGRGQEAYSYNWGGRPDANAAKSLTVLNHVGGAPLLAVAGRCSCNVDSYRQFTKYVLLAHSYFEEFAVPQMEPEARDAYEKFMKQARPHFKRLDEATAKMLIPSLADGQCAFVLDAKLKSKEWLQMLPTEKEMPMVEPAFVLGVSDAELLKKGMREYREVVNGLLAAAKEAAPPGQVPDLSLPEPQTRKVRAGTLYFYELPPNVPIDRRLMPTAGLSEKVLALAISQEHGERLLTSTPLRIEGGPLADRSRPLLSAVYFNWPACVDAAGPWIDFALSRVLTDNANVDDKQKDAILQQVRTGLEILKCFRGHASVTYVEDGATVTHSESIIQDLK